MKRGVGFTLVELLIAITLMVVLVGSLTFIFTQSSGATATGEAGSKVYNNARLTIDALETDLRGMLEFGNPLQCFVLENGIVDQSKAGNWISGTDVAKWETGLGMAENIWFGACTIDDIPDDSGFRKSEELKGLEHTAIAMDYIAFRTVAPVYEQYETIQVEYFGKPEYMDPARTFTVRTHRPLFVLTRRIRGQSQQEGEERYFNRKITRRIGEEDVPINEQELTHYAISFNVEYISSDGKFSQIPSNNQDIHPCPVGLIGWAGAPEEKEMEIGKLLGWMSLEGSYLKSTGVFDPIGVYVTKPWDANDPFTARKMKQMNEVPPDRDTERYGEGPPERNDPIYHQKYDPQDPMKPHDCGDRIDPATKMPYDYNENGVVHEDGVPGIPFTCPKCNQNHPIVPQPGISIPMLRVTIIITEDYGERVERTVTKVVRIPMAH
jgi:hypothetical protein